MSDERGKRGRAKKSSPRKPAAVAAPGLKSQTPSQDKIPKPRASQPASNPTRERGEFDFIEAVRLRAARGYAGRPHSSLITHHSSLSSDHRSSLLVGIGDDAAVLRSGARTDTVISADLLVEDVDFRLKTFVPADVGHKALAVSLSDIAAMGARPRWALLSVGLPAKVWETGFLDGFYEGFFRLAREHNVALVGGDVSRTPARVVIDSIVLGEVARGRAVLRSGARVGDQIFVTGSLGGAAAGLRVLEGGGSAKAGARRGNSSGAAALVGRQTRPAPRVEWGALLGERGLATAMIDLSDGLASDLAHLCRESRVGAHVYADAIPVNRLLTDRRALRRVPRADDLRRRAEWFAAQGGEDYELLFTVRPRDVVRLPRELGGVAATRIGEIRERRFGTEIVRAGEAHAFEPRGFDHFAGRR